MHPSVKLMWDNYIAELPLDSRAALKVPQSWHFCDNEADANDCARLVMAGTKRATSPSLWSFESANEPLPRAGDLDIVTDWGGRAVCIIRTTSVNVLPFDRISERHAGIEGEGDGTLAWWRKVHWAYYHRELEGTGLTPQSDMPIVFQVFQRVFPVGGP